MLKPLKLEEKDIKKIVQTDSFWTKVVLLLRRFVGGAFLFAVLFLVFFVLLNSPAYWKRIQFNIDPPKQSQIQPPVQPPPTQPVKNYDPAISIPKLGISAPINIDVDPNDMLTALKTGVAHYKLSAYPGQAGNSVIVGHSSDYPWSNGHYKTIFALLDKLAIGDKIIVDYQTQELTYQVSDIQVVAPTALQVLAKTDSPTLTLLTCYPVGTTRSRLIVKATLVEGQVTGTQQSDPLNNPSLPQPR